MTLALLNASSARTAASSPVVSCFTHTPALPGNRARSASSSRCSPLAGRGCCAAAALTPRMTPTITYVSRVARRIVALTRPLSATDLISGSVEEPATRCRLILENVDGDLRVLVECLEHSGESELHRLVDQECRPDGRGQRTATDAFGDARDFAVSDGRVGDSSQIGESRPRVSAAVLEVHDGVGRAHEVALGDDPGEPHHEDRSVIRYLVRHLAR